MRVFNRSSRPVDAVVGDEWKTSVLAPRLVLTERGWQPLVPLGWNWFKKRFLEMMTAMPIGDMALVRYQGTIILAHTWPDALQALEKRFGLHGVKWRPVKCYELFPERWWVPSDWSSQKCLASTLSKAWLEGCELPIVIIDLGETYKWQP